MENYTLDQLLAPEGIPCACGKIHKAGLSRVILESGAIRRLPEVIAGYGAKKVFLLADENTYEAAGARVSAVLTEAGIAHTVYCLPGKERIEPDERPVGSAIMHFDTACDLILGVGSGVVNDVGKIVANVTDRTYVIFGTAPSMDGYASATSSVIRDGLKISLNSRCADTVIGDLDILCRAPMRMILAGLGDMLAKYVSNVEWQMASIITGESFCPFVSDLILTALQKCMDQLEGLPKRDPAAIKAVMEGMILSGVAANFACVSRPVSGTEHYLSHICDMRGVEFGLPFDLHGIQCGAATIEVLDLFEKLRGFSPDREHALAYVAAFSYEDWKKELINRLGNSALPMIEGEAKEQKYNVEKHRERLEVILAHWDELQALIHSLPLASDLIPRLRAIGMPVRFSEIGFDDTDLRYAFLMSRDIRDKYIVTRLLWDLGVEM